MADVGWFYVLLIGVTHRVFFAVKIYNSWKYAQPFQLFSSISSIWPSSLFKNSNLRYNPTLRLKFHQCLAPLTSASMCTEIFTRHTFHDSDA